MKKVKVDKQALIAAILAQKAAKPMGSVHCDDPTHCTVTL
jgi:hypothetical protein